MGGAERGRTSQRRLSAPLAQRSGRAREQSDRILEFSDLSGKRNELAGNLAFGEQRRLELARVIVAKPALLLLDEPGTGMNVKAIDQLTRAPSAS